MKKVAFTAFAAAAALAASPSQAATYLTGAEVAQFVQNAGISVTGGTVVGAYWKNDDQNHLNNSNAVYTADALAALGLNGASLQSAIQSVGSGYTPTSFTTGGNLYGDIYVGLHFGGGKGKNAGYLANDTVYLHILADAGGVSAIAANSGKAYSGGYLFASGAPTTSAVPEPATWVMLMLGFGLVGATVRGRRKALSAVTA
ncbi:PEPxxWA-CTERM sorting domain-containing protein [Sphingomonas quercus]|uniref:PEPxxWA-CTERM sorting domain-containing protein n=1 Tax=Sphingomonas quercus TaxID=2842451 RepID=A0ABS6BME4_9SPHN|nr:PEPxxWA-CTERM sorting domain-containing protein [Sphingomonas quercus]MBU3079499.1 PEPxxWA-CTERM sorting domain-containing protein [Sphingomonas quercus]